MMIFFYIFGDIFYHLHLIRILNYLYIIRECCVVDYVLYRYILLDSERNRINFFFIMDMNNLYA